MQSHPGRGAGPFADRTERVAAIDLTYKVPAIRRGKSDTTDVPVGLAKVRITLAGEHDGRICIELIDLRAETSTVAKLYP